MANTVYLDGTPVSTDRQMRPRDEHDFYESPEDAVSSYLAFNSNVVDGRWHSTILDPGAGTGVWGRVTRKLTKHCKIVAVELQERFRTPEYMQWYDEWHTADFLSLELPTRFDVVLGNPPYKHAEEFFWKSRELATPNADIIFLLRLAFLGSEKRFHSMWDNRFNPTRVTVLNTRPSFTGDGKTYPTEFAIFHWKLEDGKVRTPTMLDHIVYERGFTLR